MTGFMLFFKEFEIGSGLGLRSGKPFVRNLTLINIFEKPLVRNLTLINTF